MFKFLAKESQLVILISLVIFLGFFFQVKAQVFIHPEVFVTELKINEVKEYKIKGEFTVWNNESYYLSDLNYEIKLFQGTEFEKLQLIDRKVLPETFFITPDQKITKSFSYQYPENIISGEYTLRIQLLTGTGTEFMWKDQTISLKGKDKFLEITPSSAWISIRGFKFIPQAGGAISPEETAIAIYQVKNPGEKITVIPKIKIFQRQINLALVKEYQEPPITFAKGETKEISLEMPKLDVPGSYLAEVKLYKDNKQISPVQYFNWIVEGPAGRILYIKTDKDSYKAGESIELTIDTTGPPDQITRGPGILEVTVYDKERRVVGKTSREIDLSSFIITSKVTILTEKDLISPIIEAKLIKEGKILDEHKIELPIFSEQAKQMEKIEKVEKKEKIRTYLIYLISLIVILIIGFLIYRFKK